MPAHPKEPTEPNPIVGPKRKSKGGMTAIVEAKVLQALEKKAVKDRAAAQHEQKIFPLRRIMGAVALGVWLIFMMGEFFNLVEYADAFGHDLTKWSPLFVGLLLLAPDAFDKLVAFVGRLKGLKVSLPSKEEDPPE